VHCCKYGFQSDTIVTSRRLSPYCLCWLCKRRFIELWTDKKNAKVHRVMNKSKTNRRQCSCPSKKHQTDIHQFYKNYTFLCWNDYRTINNCFPLKLTKVAYLIQGVWYKILYHHTVVIKEWRDVARDVLCRTTLINRSYSAILATLQITSYVHSRNSS
jgi:hypothetical protein